LLEERESIMLESGVVDAASKAKEDIERVITVCEDEPQEETEK